MPRHSSIDSSREQPIAFIKPIKDAQAADVILTQMADQGLITLPSRKGPLPRFAPIRITGKPLSQTIIEDREDRV